MYISHIYLSTLEYRYEEAREANILNDKALRRTRNRNATICAPSKRRPINSRLPNGKLEQDAGLFQLMKGNQLK